MINYEWKLKQVKGVKTAVNISIDKIEKVMQEHASKDNKQLKEELN